MTTMAQFIKPTGHERLVGGPVDLATELAKNFRSKDCDFESGSVNALAVVPIYYNAETLKFEWAQRPSIQIDDLTVSMGDVEKLLALSYWKAKQYDWTSGDLDYMAFNTAIGAADGDATWYVFKFEWSPGGDISRILGPVTGAWSNRAALF